MAIKASCTVTLSCYRDTQSITRYYKLQSSTASAPSKPTTKPPSGWGDSEPSYTSGSTNTLYFCDLTVFSDGTWSYSTVSKSSSYEAAKEAYNKAVAAGNTADSANNKVDNLEIGGRNLLDDTKDMDRYRNKILQDKIDGFSVVSDTYSANSHYNNICQWTSINVAPDTDYTLSFWAKGSGRIVSFLWPDAVASGKSNKGATTTRRDGLIVHTLTQEYTKYIITWRTLSDISNPKKIVIPARIDIQNTDCWINIYGFKFEKGNKATDWSPAPEDIASVEQVIDVNQKTEDIKSEVNSYKERLAEINVITEELQNCISMLVTDTNGNSLMTQTENGWTFNIDKINKSVNDISKGLDNLQNELGDTSSAINELSKAVVNVSKLSAYVKIRLEENKPCIELGTGDNNFKLLITNTDIRFMEGSSVPAYINNQSLYIKKAIVKEELKQGSFSWVLHGSGNLGLMWK